MIPTKTCLIDGIGNFTIPENEPCDIWVNWEKPIMEYVVKKLSDKGGKAYFIDVGANVGYFSVWAATRAKMVYSIEPNPNAYDILGVNSYLVRTDLGHDIEICNIALSNTDRVGQIYYRDLANGDGRLYDPKIGNPCDGNRYNIRNVPVMTLSSFQQMYCGNHRIDMIKIDCEGSEYEILQDLSFFGDKKNEGCEVVLEIHGSIMKMRGLNVENFVNYLDSKFEIRDLHGNIVTGCKIPIQGHLSLKYRGQK